MKRVITGPFGCVAYLDTQQRCDRQYPALNLPCRAFANGLGQRAVNDTYGPRVVQLSRQMRRRAALAMFDNPAKRDR